MGYVNECFLCGRKDMATVPGRFAPTIGCEDINVRYCIECLQQMQEDYEHFFEGLNWSELIRKYDRLWEKEKKDYAIRHREIIDRMERGCSGNENASGSNENRSVHGESIGGNG